MRQFVAFVRVHLATIGINPKTFHTILYQSKGAFARLKKFLLFACVFFLSLGVTVFAVGWLVYHGQNLEAHKLDPHNKSTQFYDDYDNIMQDTKIHRVNVADMPEHVKWAFVCVEDKDFYRHSGLSYNRIIKAAYKNLNARRTREGASTITQQLIKNTHLTHEKTMNRKIREAALALKLEKEFTKDQILEMYLEAIFFGNGINGLQEASRFYYDKTANDLSIRESAGLAGLLRSPARFDPIRNPDNFNERTNLVLKMMYDQQKITREQYEVARVEEIKIHARRPKCDARMYITAATSQAIGILGHRPLSDHRIYTFFDPATQDTIQNVVTSEDYQIKNISGNTADNLVIVANPNGEINALFTNNRLMPTAKRNFASALKPLVVYAPAIELGVVTPDTMILDEPYASGDFHPKNHDGKFRGNVSVRESLAQSYNIPTVKILEYTTIPRAVDVGRRLGLPLDDETLGLGLGATGNGVTSLQLLGGFCALANGGHFTSPSFIKRIENSHGEITWEHTPPYQYAVSPDTAAIVTSMLTDAVKHGTARKMASLNFDIAAKTGTAERQSDTPSSNNTDAINMSYTPERVLLVWNGNADMKPQNDLPQGTTGGGKTTFIARDIMAKTAGDSQAKFTPPPENISAVSTSVDQQMTINLTGRVGETGAPNLTFNTETGKKYEIYRRIDGNESILQVIRPDQSREHLFIDKSAPQKRVIDYWVKSNDVTSNTVKIYTLDNINKDAVPAPRQSKHWFF